MAEISLGKVFMTPKGVWDGTKQYQSLDIVMVRGATSSTGYISTDVIPANTPINDKRWKPLFVVNDGEATADFNNKVNKVDANKKAIDTIYAELQKMYGVQISDTEPTEERTGIWVDTSSTETFSVPEIKDNVVNTTDTWSSQKINQMVSVDSYVAKSDACADDDRIAIYDSVSKTQKKALFGGGVWNWIVNKLTNAVISNLQTNNKTVLGAINELNSKVFIKTQNLSTFSINNIKLNKNTYTSFIMYGATSQNNGFMYIVFIDVASAKRAVNFIKIADFLAGRTFSGTYSDDTSTLTINASDTIWGGIKLLMFKEEKY